MARYAIKLDEKRYVKNWAWISDTTPLVLLMVDNLKNATLFEENLEEDFKKVYPEAKAIPVYIKPM